MSISPEDRARVVQRLLHPRSVAVIGASADFGKVNGRPLKHLIEKGYAGRILPVNPKYTEIAGLACYASVDDLPEAADVAVVALPASEVIGCIEQLGRKGIRGAVIFSSGFGEMGAEGKALEAELARAAARAGVVLLGPNCLGFINAFENVYATFSQYADGGTNSGPIAFVTQSGAFGTAIAALVRQRGLGLGYFVNTGNQIDLDFSELMLAVIEDPRITVAAGYMEGVTDGEGLIALAKRCRELGKPLVLTKVGRLASGARAAASHTGAMAVVDTLFDAVLKQYGVLRARNEEQMLDMLEVFAQPRRAAGNGLGIATQSGGAGVMMADRAEEVGLRVPELKGETRRRLLDTMPAFGAAGNPVDVTGQFVARPELLRESVVTLLDDPDIDICIVWLQLMTAHVKTLVGIFLDIQKRTTKPFLVCWVAAPREAVDELRSHGIVVFGAGERAVEAAAALARYRPPAVPAAEPAPAGDPLDGFAEGAVDTVSAARLLGEAGIPMAPVALATTADEAVALWRGHGRPVALKIESPDILHKTEIGGVALNLDSEEAIRAAHAALLSRARSARPQARICGVIVQPMRGGDVELVIGVRRDLVFGMMVMVGLGGVLVEVLKDVSFRRAPFGAAEAERMLGELRMSPVLDGVRGKPPVDRVALARLLSRLSQWAHAASDSLSELDLNPVMASGSEMAAVDCVLVVERRRSEEDAGERAGRTG